MAEKHDLQNKLLKEVHDVNSALRRENDVLLKELAKSRDEVALLKRQFQAKVKEQLADLAKLREHYMKKEASLQKSHEKLKKSISNLHSEQNKLETGAKVQGLKTDGRSQYQSVGALSTSKSYREMYSQKVKKLAGLAAGKGNKKGSASKGVKTIQFSIQKDDIKAKKTLEESFQNSSVEEESLETYFKTFEKQQRETLRIKEEQDQIANKALQSMASADKKDQRSPDFRQPASKKSTPRGLKTSGSKPQIP